MNSPSSLLRSFLFVSRPRIIVCSRTICLFLLFLVVNTMLPLALSPTCLCHSRYAKILKAFLTKKSVAFAKKRSINNVLDSLQTGIDNENPSITTKTNKANQSSALHFPPSCSLPQQFVLRVLDSLQSRFLSTLEEDQTWRDVR